MEGISQARLWLGLVRMFGWIRLCRMLRLRLRHHLLDDIWNMIHSALILLMKRRKGVLSGLRHFKLALFSFLFFLFTSAPPLEPLAFFFYSSNKQTNFASIMICYDTDDYNSKKWTFFCIVIFLLFCFFYCTITTITTAYIPHTIPYMHTLIQSFVFLQVFVVPDRYLYTFKSCYLKKSWSALAILL